jgi:hypothetical protein
MHIYAGFIYFRMNIYIYIFILYEFYIYIYIYIKLKTMCVWAWLTSLNMKFSSSIHLPANDMISFFFYGLIKLYSVCIPNFLNPFISHGASRLSKAWLLWMQLQYIWLCKWFYHILDHIPSDICLAVVLLDCVAVLFLVFWKTSILLSIVVALIYNPTNSIEVFLLPWIKDVFALSSLELKFIFG